MLKWFIPASIGLFVASALLHAFHAPVAWNFIVTGVAIIPVAGWMGRSTESIAAHAGPRVGGLLSATFGNAVELIIGIIALSQGMNTLVKASITGSILGNLLFVLGISFVVGGLQHPIQRFNVRAARNHASMLLLGIGVVFIIPAAFAAIHPQVVDVLSPVAACVSLALYLLGLLFALFTHREMLESMTEIAEPDGSPPLRLGVALGFLAVTTVLVSFESEWLVGSLDAVARQLGWSEVFMGVIIVAIVGNAAEHASAVWMAWKNRMDLSLEIAVGSTLQVAMFVAPVLLLAAMLMGQPMNLLFTWPELISMVMAVLLVVVLMLDGESNWMEGALALGAYAVMAVGFFLF
ncbi:MAG: calcium/proton exchanger [Alicyclobacillus sp.]|nr:calcium/proton exchanger [Alicyclobacillus sp.]